MLCIISNTVVKNNFTVGNTALLYCSLAVAACMMMRFVTKATAMQYFDSNSHNLKMINSKKLLKQSSKVQIMQLVICGLGGGLTDMHMHIPMFAQK